MEGPRPGKGGWRKRVDDGGGDVARAGVVGWVVLLAALEPLLGRKKAWLAVTGREKACTRR